jgi:hypothetical protein
MLSDNLLITSASLIGLVVVAVTLLSGWQGWLAFKRRELETRRVHHHGAEIEGGAHEGAARIEIADLKERIRKLEAIASGVDL